MHAATKNTGLMRPFYCNNLRRPLVMFLFENGIVVSLSRIALVCVFLLYYFVICYRATDEIDILKVPYFQYPKERHPTTVKIQVVTKIFPR